LSVPPEHMRSFVHPSRGYRGPCNRAIEHMRSFASMQPRYTVHPEHKKAESHSALIELNVFNSLFLNYYSEAPEDCAFCFFHSSNDTLSSGSD